MARGCDLSTTFPHLPDTAAEAMDGEMPSGHESANWAAGPTLSELVKADEADEELDRRRWEAEWAEASQ